jgi:CheY-like chemotaxis protein
MRRHRGEDAIGRTDAEGLGERDGLAVARAVRSRYPNAPILVVTGTVRMGGRLQELLNLSGTRYLEKPFSREALLGALEALFTPTL